MSTSINPEAIGELPRVEAGRFGPSDSSDSGSDVTGTFAEAQDSDAAGTGERRSIEALPNENDDADIEPDRIFRAGEMDSSIEDAGLESADVSGLDFRDDGSAGTGEGIDHDEI